MLLGVASQIGERQHHDAWLVVEGLRCCLCCSGGSIFLYFGDETHTSAGKCANNALRSTTVVDSPPCRIEARRQCRISNNPPAPHVVDQIVLADHTVTVTHQIDEKIENLGFEGDPFCFVAQLTSLDVKRVIAKLEDHEYPRSARGFGFSVD